MKKKYYDFSISYIKKTTKSSMIFLLVISLFELVFGLKVISKGFRGIGDTIYFSLYVFLFLVSLITFLVAFYYDKNMIKDKVIYTFNHIYYCSIVLWSSLITTMDIYKDNSSGTIVFLTVAMGIGCSMSIIPLFYIIYTWLNFGLILLCMFFHHGYIDYGLASNMLVFMIVTTIINNFVFNLNYKNYTTAKQLNDFSYLDSLTGLSNRRKLDEEIDTFLLSPIEKVFVMIDIDDFKKINDTFGHKIGDEALINVSKKLKEKFKRAIYRYGGDEFAVMSFYDISKTAVLLEEVNNELLKEYTDIKLQISAGLYRITKSKDDKIFINADKALYTAKSKGKAQTYIFIEKDI